MTSSKIKLIKNKLEYRLYFLACWTDFESLKHSLFYKTKKVLNRKKEKVQIRSSSIFSASAARVLGLLEHDKKGVLGRFSEVINSTGNVSV